MEIEDAIEVLDPNLSAIDFKKYPKAVSSGMWPTDVEMSTATEARIAVKDLLQENPFKTYGDLIHDYDTSKRIKFSLNS